MGPAKAWFRRAFVAPLRGATLLRFVPALLPINLSRAIRARSGPNRPAPPRLATPKKFIELPPELILGFLLSRYLSLKT
jgi:hypothetical protein